MSHVNLVPLAALTSTSTSSAGKENQTVLTL